MQSIEQNAENIPGLAGLIATESMLAEKYERLWPRFAFGDEESYALDAARSAIDSMKDELVSRGFSPGGAARYATVLANLYEDLRVQDALLVAGFPLHEQERVTPMTPFYLDIPMTEGTFSQLESAYSEIWQRLGFDDPLYDPATLSLMRKQLRTGKSFELYSILGSLHLLS